MSPRDEAIVTDAVDLTRLNLDELANLDNPVLRDALTRLRADMEQPRDAIAGFQAAT